MNSPRTPLPPVLRWLAILPAIIVVAEYTFMAPAAPSKTPPARVAVVETPPLISQQLVKSEGQSVRLNP